ncbi:MAG: hypothetical protein MOB07_10105 [Acidobacteria bacterium]|nr:hypothetical protein [Acidobacteriota bacterium]
MKNFDRPPVPILMALIGAFSVFSMTLPADARPPFQWQELSVAEMNFSVLFPGEPKMSRRVAEIESNRVTILTYEGTDLPGLFKVMVSEYPQEFDTPTKVNHLLDNAHWLTIAKENTQLISQREVKLGNYLGREIKAKNSEVLVMEKPFR